MSAAQGVSPEIAPVTIEAFDAFLDTVEDPRVYELIEFDIIMMDNPTDIHEEIFANIATSLKAAMQKRDCSVFMGGIRVQRDEDAKTGDKPKPDIVVRCGPLTGKRYVTDPIVVVEVLSPATMDYDRGQKLQFYKSLPSLQHVVLVYQNERRIEHHERIGVSRLNEDGEDESWRMTALTEAAARLDLTAVAFSIDVAEIYRHVPN
jgi:Uma2 family endonuclease